jgi:transcriptional antiterminator Rof (Rho-off)
VNQQSVARKERLGHWAVLLLPSVKLKSEIRPGMTFQQEVHEFLIRNFRGYTVSFGNISGYWKDSEGREQYGEHREYKVALSDKNGRERLEAFLARLAADLREECVYLELPEGAWLIRADGIRAVSEAQPTGVEGSEGK